MFVCVVCVQHVCVCVHVFMYVCVPLPPFICVCLCVCVHGINFYIAAERKVMMIVRKFCYYIIFSKVTSQLQKIFIGMMPENMKTQAHLSEFVRLLNSSELRGLISSLTNWSATRQEIFKTKVVYVHSGMPRHTDRSNVGKYSMHAIRAQSIYGNCE